MSVRAVPRALPVAPDCSGRTFAGRRAVGAAMRLRWGGAAVARTVSRLRRTVSGRTFAGLRAVGAAMRLRRGGAAAAEDCFGSAPGCPGRNFRRTAGCRGCVGLSRVAELSPDGMPGVRDVRHASGLRRSGGRLLRADHLRLSVR